MFSLQFFMTSLVVVLIPGTGVIYTISIGLLHTSRKSIWAAIGCTLGIVPHLLACILGLSAIMNMSAQVFTLLKMLGAGYLLYLAWKTWSTAGGLATHEEKREQNALQIVQRGILLNLLNPKLTLFFFAFLPQFIPAHSETALLSMVVLSGMFMGMTLIIFMLYGLLASSISHLIMHNKRILRNIERGFACVFAGLALKLAFTEK